MLKRRSGCGAMLAALLVLGMAPAAAKVTRLEIASKQPYGSFRSGDYVIWQGRVHGELAPTEAIPDIDKPQRNARGQIEYSARELEQAGFLLPEDAAIIIQSAAASPAFK